MTRPLTRDGRIVNAMTVDLEDWFHAWNLGIDRSDWDRQALRVAIGTEVLLDLFREAGVKATFFVLAWVAERQPNLIRRLVAEGHELASHGYAHELVHAIGEQAFAADLLRAREVFAGIVDAPVHGYRAPTFSIAPAATPWAHRTLRETGHRYSSSVFPGRHAGAAARDLPPGPFQPFADGVGEIPMTALRAGGRMLPASGGGWFRMLPYQASAALLRRVNTAEQRPGIFYIHPWELDPDQPRVRGLSARKTFQHYLNIDRTAPRMRRLLRDFAWDRMDVVFGSAIGDAAPAAGDGRTPLRAAA